MSATVIPQAAGITGILTAAGLGEREVHWWFHRPRRELCWLTPAFALSFAGAIPSAPRAVLDLARHDAAELVADLPVGWEGSE